MGIVFECKSIKQRRELLDEIKRNLSCYDYIYVDEVLGMLDQRGPYAYGDKGWLAKDFRFSTHDNYTKKTFDIIVESEPTIIINPFKPTKAPDPTDNVNHPKHYKSKNGLECIEVIDAATEGLTGIEATHTGQVIKYIWRWKKKNGVEDLKKAKWYLDRLINHLEKENDNNE